MKQNKIIDTYNFKFFLKEFYRPSDSKLTTNPHNDFANDFFTEEFEESKKCKTDKEIFSYLDRIPKCSGAEEVYENLKQMYKTYKKFYKKGEW